MARILNTRALPSILLAGASIIAMTVSAAAADQQTAANPANNIEEIVVTGSRVVTNGAEAPTPLTVVSASDLAVLAPSNIPDAINQLPQLVGSTNQYIAGPIPPGSSGPSVGNYANLRGLGQNRVLVLLDGQRVAPTSYTGAIDQNTLPQALVTRVDVVTGGASAVYGSDALSGVVNYVLDKKFTGLKGLVQGGVSKYGDALQGKFNIVGGTDIGDRIHVEGSFEFYNAAKVDSFADRPFGSDLYHYGTAGLGTKAAPFFTQRGLNFVTNSWQGTIESGSFNKYIFNNDGSIRPLNVGVSTLGSGGYGGDGAWFAAGEESLFPSQRTTTGFARASYDISDNTTFYTQWSYSYTGESYEPFEPNNQGPGPAQVLIFSDNAYLTPATRTQLFGANPSPTASFIFAKDRGINIGTSFENGADLPNYHAYLRQSAWRAQLGVDGELWDAWKYNVNYSHNLSRLAQTDFEINMRNYGAAMDAVKAPNGQIVCAVSLTQYASLYPGCLPINEFGLDPNRPGAPNAASAAFVMNDFWVTDRIQTDIVDVSTNGTLFDVPAGAVKAALGGEFRHQTLDQETDAWPGYIDYTGLRDVSKSVNSQVFASDTDGPAHGFVDVVEGFAELDMPVLKDVPLARYADVDVAGRMTHYGTSGTVETWKVGLNDQLFDSLRFRGNISRDIRAPSLYELFATLSTQGGGFTDVQTGLNQSVPRQSGGEPGLKPEIGTTYTLGGVFTPIDWLPGLTVSADYYNIKVRGAIGSTNPTLEDQQCVASNFTSPVCADFIRPLGPSNTSAANYPTLIIVHQANFAKLDTSGLDIEASYTTPLFGGRLSFRVLATRLFHYIQQTDPTTAPIEYAGFLNGSAVLTKFKGSLTTSYNYGPMTFTMTNRMTGKAYQSPTTVWAPGDNRLPNLAYTNMAFTYDLPLETVKSQWFLNVANVFNQKYPIRGGGTFPNESFPTIRQMYDIMGRYFTTGVRFQL